MIRSFDLFLELPTEDEEARQALWTALADVSALQATPDDPSRLMFRDTDTSVHFSVVVRRDLLPDLGTDEWGDEVPTGTDVLPDDHEDPDDDEEDDWDEEDHGDEDADDEESEGFTEMPLIALNIPLLRPRFFVREVIEVIEQLRQATTLRVVHPDEHGESEIEFAPEQQLDEEPLVESWDRLNRALVEELRDRHRFVGWSPDQVSRFYAFGKARPQIVKALSEESIEVPVLQPAATDETIGSLIIWDPNVSTVIPRCDLVLVHIPVEKRGLLRTKTVIEERVVPGDRAWDIASRHGEFRSVPTEHIIYRHAAPPAQDLIESLLELPVLGNAKRTELAGVLDAGLLVEDAGSGDETERPGE